MRMSRIALGLMLALPLPALALDLASAWQMVRLNDPGYQAALKEREAGEENRGIGRAGLLPQLSANANRNRVKGELEQPNFLGQMAKSDINYTSMGKSVQLRQPLFNWARFAEFRQGEARADYSVARLQQREQEIAVQLAERYFEVLLARDTITLSQTRLRAIQQQLDAAQRRFELGDGTVTEIDEAQARRDLARAEQIEAEDRLQVARRALQEMLGSPPVKLAGLKPAFTPPPLMPAEPLAWQQKVDTQNPQILSLQAGLKVAQMEVERARGGHLPTLDLVGSYGQADSETLSTRNQRSTTTSIGVQINIPLFSGGYQSALLRQAVASSERAQFELEATREQMASELERHYRGVVNGALRVRAHEQAVVSSERALLSMKKGMQAGDRTTLDILNAEDQLYQAQRDLLQGRLRYLLARLSLAAVAGELDDVVFREVNGYLQEQT